MNGRWGVGGVKKKPGISQEFISRALAVQGERALRGADTSTVISCNTPQFLYKDVKRYYVYSGSTARQMIKLLKGFNA